MGMETRPPDRRSHFNEEIVVELLIIPITIELHVFNLGAKEVLHMNLKKKRKYGEHEAYHS
jgi:hypothetical protein